MNYLRPDGSRTLTTRATAAANQASRWTDLHGHRRPAPWRSARRARPLARPAERLARRREHQQAGTPGGVELGTVAGWDYQTALSYNQNKVKENLHGYSDGGDHLARRAGRRDQPVRRPERGRFGPAEQRSAERQPSCNAKGISKGADIKLSREVGDWLNTGRQAGLAVGAQYEHQKFRSAANTEFAEKVVASTGIDPNTLNEGSRSVSAFFSELNVPLLKNLDVTAAVRYDKYSDFGHTANPKFSFTYRPVGDVLLRGSYSKASVRLRCMKSMRPPRTPIRRKAMTRSTAQAATRRQASHPRRTASSSSR
jgi:outer membrane receptor protein involved in Fe transport